LFFSKWNFRLINFPEGKLCNLWRHWQVKYSVKDWSLDLFWIRFQEFWIEDSNSDEVTVEKIVVVTHIQKFQICFGIYWKFLQSVKYFKNFVFSLKTTKLKCSEVLRFCFIHSWKLRKTKNSLVSLNFSNLYFNLVTEFFFRPTIPFGKNTFLFFLESCRLLL
jgi:hypothetical protein